MRLPTAGFFLGVLWRRRIVGEREACRDCCELFRREGRQGIGTNIHDKNLARFRVFTLDGDWSQIGYVMHRTSIA